MRKMKSLACLGFALFFLFHSPASRAQESQTGAETRAAEPNQALLLSEKSKTRLDEIEDDLAPLQKRIVDGDKSLQQEAANVPPFLEIQDIALEEFRPYLNRWKLMLDSYRYVLQDVESQIDEVAKIRTRLHSKLQLWKLKESDAKLAVSQLPRGQQNPGLQAELDDIRDTLRSLEQESDHSDSVMGSLGKAKTALSQDLDLCIKNYNLLSKRWEKVRFSRLKWVNQPSFSLESLSVAFQELEYRWRNAPSYWASLKEYLHSIAQALSQNLARAFLCGAMWAFLAFLFIKRGRHREERSPPNTSLGRFLHQAGDSFQQGLPYFLFLLAQGILLAAFPELREARGYWLFAFSAGLWAAWFLWKSSLILFVDRPRHPKLSPLPARSARAIHRHFSVLILLVLAFFLLDFSSYLLEYDSEASRTLEWFLEILIFLVLISLVRPSWMSFLIDRSLHQSLLRPLKHGFRALLFSIFVLVLSLDAMGYTYLSDYIADATLKSMGAILLMILLKNALKEWLDHALYARLMKRPQLHFSIVRQWVNSLQLWTQTGLWILFIYSLAAIWDVVPEFNALLWRFWNWGFLVGPMHITAGLLISVLLIFYVSTLLSHLIQFLLERNLYPRKDWDPGIQQACSTGVRYLMALIALLVSLRILGFGLQNITVLAGALGVGLGFGLQNIANNFASGIILLIERPIKVDDVIQVNNVTGRVRKIGPRSTVLETADKASILIPNGELLAGQLTNWTYGNSVAGFAIPVGVAYGTDLQKVRELLLKIGTAHPNVLKDPAPRVEFKEFADSSLNFILRVWIEDVDGKVDAQTDLMFQVEKAFRENGIDIPFPQRVIYTKQET